MFTEQSVGDRPVEAVPRESVEVRRRAHGDAVPGRERVGPGGVDGDDDVGRRRPGAEPRTEARHVPALDDEIPVAIDDDHPVGIDPRGRAAGVVQRRDERGDVPAGPVSKERRERRSGRHRFGGR